ncbi:5-hydroxytryptamine receptor 1A-alpha-like [Hydractinia symbiolongicarpus]|uniref:5-hydroxytryptamine receptor 1A-alpha-like n=1 Tax=Hydractinia symbiolongicarpus TaxID=13093 RepID=UPI00254DBC0B|nr:5-hydroxytryptamine receptor 1A-alpha-like [Hydractinia symbiolongicarpus]XP_057289357.1 5-hydroxytryptamine receptor 1A-alpha-like [Hydractinia symbiolongicarpus]
MNVSSNQTDSDPYGLQAITDGERYFNTLFLTIVMVLTILGNSIALHAFIVTPDLKKVTYYFIASLCISDLMVAIFSIPLWIVEVLSNWSKLSQTWRVLYACVDILCGTWSIMSLAMISIERYLCITYAMKYFRIMTMNKVYIIFAFVTVYSVTVTVVDSKQLKDTGYIVKQFVIFTMSFVIPVLIKLFTYGKIYEEARKQTKQINALQKVGQSIHENDINNDAEVNSDSSTNSLNKNIHSSSRVSWTASPLARKRQCTQARIQVLSEVNEDDNVSDSLDASEKTSSTISFYKWLFKHEKYKRKKYNVTDENGSLSNGSNKINTSPLVLDKKEIFVRQDTNGSIASVVRYNAKATSVDQNSKGNKGIKKKKKRMAQSMKESYIVIQPDDVGERKRSVSCPDPYRQNTSRKSLEPNDAFGIETVDGKKVVHDPLSSPSLSQRLRSYSKWSPTNSPLLLRKSLRRSNNNNNNNNNRHLQKLRRFKKELRAAKVVGLIMGTFLLCWTPFMIMVLLDPLGVIVKVRYVMIAKYLHYLNSAINPILYVILNKVYRKAILKVVKKIKRHIYCS